jgi:hypothetical protein
MNRLHCHGRCATSSKGPLNAGQISAKWRAPFTGRAHGECSNLTSPARRWGVT